MQQHTATSFEEWRSTARQLLAAGVEPDNIVWHDGRQRQRGLFSEDSPLPSKPSQRSPQVSRKFIELSRLVAHHRASERWHLLYRLLWRLVNETPHLLDIALDDDVFRASEMEKQVRRDRHKMRAFVRFNLQYDDRGEHYVAWYEPDHYTLRLNAPFFSDRFSGMRWTIFTPDDSLTWDRQRLTWGLGVEKDQVTRGDEMHDAWRTYYSNIFNPARVKTAAMKREMPVRFWKNLPEAEIIGDLLANAPSRVAAMAAHTEGWTTTAADWLPQDRSFESLSAAARSCQACPLCGPATQMVFGEGPTTARIMLIGEQPGDEEDRAGRPFVGPAGRVLMDVLKDAEINRGDLYLTNAVKHFGFEWRGKHRLHKTPRRLDVISCRPWLDAELATISPDVVVCLGATALQALVGPTTRLHDVLGETLKLETGAILLATYHPSAVLRSRDAADADRKRGDLLAALTRARELTARWEDV